MSSQGKLSIRPLPHLDFVLGWPGIAPNKEASRNAAHIAGNVEVRLGSKGMKASWLRIELRKIETVPGGENWGELIGSGPIDVWSARSGTGKGDREQDSDGTCWEILKTNDFPFRINIPEALPPSARLDKICGLQYELVTSLCVKTKKGFMRKEDTSSVMQSVQPITLDKHEMHSTWPAYNIPDTHTGERDSMRAKLRRERYCYAPGDKIRVKVIVQSNRVEPAKLKSVAVTIKETVTFHGVKPSKKAMTSNSNSAQPSMQRVEVVTQKAKQIGKKIYKGDSKDYDIELVIPKNHALMTISTGKHIEVSYTMRLYVDISKCPIVIDHVPMMMTTFPRQASLSLMKKIGFVEGLSERDMLIDDDFDDASTSQGVSRSTRPIPSRSLSFAGSSSTGGGYENARLQRRDTVMTNATGGMAGRGVPGQLYSYGNYGPPPLPTSSPAPFYAAEGPRPAFAGPGDGDDQQLSEQERNALYHHSNDPRNAIAMGVDYGAVASLEPTRSSFLPSRGPTDSPARFSFAGFPSSATPISRPSTANAIPNSAEANAAAEEEKERLYLRARLQAERNQRRADEARAALAAGGTGDTANTLPASESEKLRLWERARREAELYQRSFSEGANFPAEGSANNSRMHTPALPRVDEDASSDEGPPGGYPNPNPHESRLQRPMSVQQDNRNSAMFWLDNPTMAAAGPPAPSKSNQGQIYPSYASAEDEKRRLYEQAKAETDAHMHVQDQSIASSSNMTPSSSANIGDVPSYSASVSGSHTNGLSEKEQMKRFYAAQDAVNQYQANLDEGGESSAAVNAPKSDVSGISSNLPSTSQSQPLSEKEQMARYHAAQAEVQRNLANSYDTNGVASSSGSTVQNKPVSQPLGEKEQLARYHAAQAEVERYTSQQAVSPAPGGSNGKTVLANTGTSTFSEKEQMRQYWEARDREAQKNNQAAAVAAAQANTSQSPHMMASPRPVYAPNFHGLPFTAPSDVRASPATTPLPQGPFVNAPASNGNVKPRVVSYTPTTQHSQQSQPQHSRSQSNAPPVSSLSIPPLSRLSLNHRGGTPSPFEGPWAPKVASSAWEDESGNNESNDSDALPPPLPPKTMLSHS